MKLKSPVVFQVSAAVHLAILGCLLPAAFQVRAQIAPPPPARQQLRTVSTNINAWKMAAPWRHAAVTNLGPVAKRSPSPFEGAVGETRLLDAGPNHLAWSRTAPEPSAPGSNTTPRLSKAPQATRTAPQSSRVVAIGSGMNYWDGQKWSPSEAAFELAADAFVADKVQHRARLNAELNVMGAVTTTLKDGTTLKSTPVAIALYDPNDGRFAVVSTVTNSTGILLQSNKVVYPQAFQGGVCASAVYTLEKGSFEQDIVITGGFNPGAYGFPADCQVQIITEFYEAPRPEKRRRPIYVEKDPAIRSRKVSPDRVDEVLGFGDLVIGTGKAYTAPTESNPKGFSGTVSKELLKTSDGRVFLVETVEYRSIKKGIEGLPPCGATQATIRKDRLTELANISKPRGTLEAKAAPTRATAEFASLMDNRKAVTIDYRMHIGGSLNDAKVFQGDTTWMVVEPLYCNGPVTIEGGAVFKYKAGTSIGIFNSLTMKTSGYSPAIFTAMDDDSIGISAAGYQNAQTGYTGTIASTGYANPALYFEAPTQIHHCRFLYAQQAVTVNSWGAEAVDCIIADSQFVKSLRGINIFCYGCGPLSSGIMLSVENSLFSEVDYIFGGGSSAYTDCATFTHCTMDQALVLVDIGGGDYWGSEYGSMFFSAYNCVFSRILQRMNGSGLNVDMNGDYNGFYRPSPYLYRCEPFGDNTLSATTDPFQESGGGLYYLKVDSDFRAAGSSTFASPIVGKTTSPPLDFPRFMEVTGELALFPQTPRYASGPPDLGAYYEPLDYTVAAMLVTGGTIRVHPGTAIGIRQEYAPEWEWWWPMEYTHVGFLVENGASFISRATRMTQSFMPQQG